MLSIEREVDLGAMNTLALPSRARYFVRIDDEAQVPAAVRWARAQEQPIFVLGGGSNLILVSELDALVMQMSNRGIRRVHHHGDSVEFTVAAGENWHALVVETLARGWFGLENLALIPGTVGAAPVQNIGAYGVELERFVVAVRVFDIAQQAWRDLDRASCAFSYRDSLFRHDGGQRFIIGSVTLRLALRPCPDVHYAALAAELARRGHLQATPADVFDAVVAIRAQKLPAPEVLPNAGSFFKNPLVSRAQYDNLLRRYPQLVGYPQDDGQVKLAAGWLLDQAGFKGHTSVSESPGRGVGMHREQALVLINHGGATADDIMAYAKQVRAAVHARFGVALEREPLLIGADGARL